VTGVGEKRFPGSCVQTEERLCAWPFGPWNRREAARHYPRIHIRVAVVRSEPDAGNDVAQDVEKHGSARDAKAAAERLVELAAAYAFAAVYAGEVRDQQLHDVGVRELFEERTQFGVASDAAASCHAFRFPLSCASWRTLLHRAAGLAFRARHARAAFTPCSRRTSLNAVDSSVSVVSISMSTSSASCSASRMPAMSM